MKNQRLNTTENNTTQAAARATPKNEGTTQEMSLEQMPPQSEGVQQRKLQNLVDHKPAVKQFSTYQEIADNSPRLKRGAMIQRMADRYVAQPKVIQLGQCGGGSSPTMAGGGKITGPKRGNKFPKGTGGIVLWSTKLNEPVVLTNAHVVFAELPGAGDDIRMRSIGAPFRMNGVALTVHAAIRAKNVYSQTEYGQEHEVLAKKELGVRYAPNVNDAAILRVRNRADIDVAMDAIGMVGKRQVDACALPQERGGEVSKKGQTTGRQTSGGYYRARGIARGEYQTTDRGFAAEGDSGSVVLDEQNQLIGLLVSAKANGQGEFDSIGPILNVFQLEIRAPAGE